MTEATFQKTVEQFIKQADLTGINLKFTTTRIGNSKELYRVALGQKVFVYYGRFNGQMCFHLALLASDNIRNETFGTDLLEMFNRIKYVLA